MYVVIFCFGVALIVLEVLASKNNKRIAATSLPESRWLLMYRWRYIVGAPLAVASAFVSYPLSSGEDRYQITGFPFLVMAIDQRGWDYAGFLSLPFLVLNGLVWLLLPSLALWGASRIRRSDYKKRTTT
jgi:hypothetical protein